MRHPRIARTVFRIVLAGALAWPSVGWAQAGRGPLSLEAGIGFTADPDAFLLAIALPWEISDELSLGPLVQFGFDDDFTLIAPTINGRYTLDLSSMTTSGVSRLRPHVDLGFGFAYAELDDVPSFVDDDDIEFMFNFGFGAEYPINNTWSVGSRMRFNILPDDLFNENFFFSWEVVGARLRF